MSLRGAPLQGLSLVNTVFRGCDLTDADLGGADCAGADFTMADLSGTRFEGACLLGARLEHSRNLDFANLRGALVVAATLPDRTPREFPYLGVLPDLVYPGRHAAEAPLPPPTVTQVQTGWFWRLLLKVREKWR